jgi:hypothetical protein
MEVLNMKKRFILFALVLALGCLFITCELDTAQFATVTFEDPIGENIVEPVTLKRGETLGGKLPESYEKAGFVFRGWFDGGTQYFPTSPVGADITLITRWSPILEYATVSFAFVEPDSDGYLIKPVSEILPITVEKGQPLGFSLFPINPRAKGWEFDTWYMEDGKEFTTATPIVEDMTVTATWIQKTSKYTVTFDPGPGVTPIPAPIEVFAGECINEWENRFPRNPTRNPINARAFFVMWHDEEKRVYTGRTPITRDVKITGKWGLPPFVVDFDKHLEYVQDWGGARGDLVPEVRNSYDGKRVIVNTKTYDVPNNAGRWEILYRIKFKWPDDFSTGFYTRYTIRARFYANQQGAKSWTGGGFKPNNPADASGYSSAGRLFGINNPSDDGWGQVSWTLTEAATGEGANATTIIQRYNLDRKGGTIDDSWESEKGTPAERAKPPYLIIQTSDNYIGHIEITQIVFHNGEEKYTMYEDEEGYATANDGLGN